MERQEASEALRKRFAQRLEGRDRIKAALEASGGSVLQSTDLLASGRSDKGSRKGGWPWGNWVYNAETLTLDWKGDPDSYYINLEECRDAHEVLDWLAQISHKNWATPADVGHLLIALDALLDIQGTLVHRTA